MTEQHDAARKQAKAEAWEAVLLEQLTAWLAANGEEPRFAQRSFQSAYYLAHYDDWSAGFDRGWAAGEALVRGEYEARIAEMERASEDARLEFMETDR